LAAAPAGLPAASIAPTAVAAPSRAAPARSAVGPAAVDGLRFLSAPDVRLDSGRAFDGSRAAASNGVEPAPFFTSPAAAPRLTRPSPRRSATGRFLNAAAAGVGAAALAPFLWHAIPTSAALILFVVAVAPVAAAGALWTSFRVARRVYRRLSGSAAAPAAPSSPRRTLAVRAAGLALGIAMTATVAHHQQALVVDVHAALDARRPVAERQFRTKIPGRYFATEAARELTLGPKGRSALDGIRGRDGSPRMPAFFVTGPRQPVVALPGTGFADATAALLSRTATGREVLDGLRDRGGVLRMPAFFVSDQEGSAARYTPPDAVFLSVQTIEAGGVTVERFLRDPAAQAAYLEREQAILVHELKHADQARRSPFSADTKVLLRTDAARLVSAIRAYLAPASAVAPTSAAVPAEPVRSVAPDVSAAPVTLSAAEIERSGATVQNFLHDREAQKKYIRDHREELAAALRPVHAAAPSAPRSATSAAAKPAFHVSIGMIQEWEYEAYFTEHFYTDERLRADPARDMSDAELANYAGGLMDFDEFLASIDGYSIYAANFHGGSPYYRGYMARERALWNQHLVDANVLLARRAAALGRPAEARSRLERARDFAGRYGLPAPVLVLPPR
jgi:hypothetical protein